MNKDKVYTDLYYLNQDMEANNYSDFHLYKTDVVEYVSNMYNRYKQNDVNNMLEHFPFIRNYYHFLVTKKN
jgi:hypothetical protein